MQRNLCKETGKPKIEQFILVFNFFKYLKLKQFCPAMTKNVLFFLSMWVKFFFTSVLTIKKKIEVIELYLASALAS